VGAGVSAPALPDLTAALASWVARPELWQPLVRADAAERTYELLHRDELLELYVVCWMDGHDTGFHDHDHSAAAIAVLQGTITEERLALRGPVEQTLGAGEHVAIAPEAIHRVRHAAGAPAVSLHAYSPPLNRVGTYEVASDGALLRHPRPADVPLEVAA
jgi:predicted metal-dependent enzyme (double-stranded beta helix superfamily)